MEYVIESNSNLDISNNELENNPDNPDQNISATRPRERRSSQRSNRSKISNSPLDNPYNCWICLQFIQTVNERFYPCYCNTPVHRCCLNSWLTSSGRQHCPMCRFKYRYRTSYKFIGFNEKFFRKWMVISFFFILLDCLPIYGYNYQTKLGTIVIEYDLIMNDDIKLLIMFSIWMANIIIFISQGIMLMILYEYSSDNANNANNADNADNDSVTKKQYKIIFRIFSLEMLTHLIGYIMFNSYFIEKNIIIDDTRIHGLSFITFFFGLPFTLIFFPLFFFYLLKIIYSNFSKILWKNLG